jgi:pimeloyl-ACP methyl ester carboxylesterase
VKRRRVPRAIVLLLAVTLGLGIGVGADILRDGGLEAWLRPPDPGPTFQRLGRTVEVEGRAVYVDCRGTGGPTVILEAGLGGGADGWGVIFDRLAGATRTCAWDRPGIGSSADRGVHSGTDTSRDLLAALAAAGERGPYVVVAHSFGGVYARLFAATAPDAVVALVMLDTYDPDLGMENDPTLDEAFHAAVRRALDETAVAIEAAEHLDWPRTLLELHDTGAPEARMLVLSTDPNRRYQDPDPARQERMVAAWRRAIAALYPKADIEIVSTGHFVHLDDPDLVFERVAAIISRVREPG